MKNKVLKHVVLFACVLGLVLFPVTYSFGTDYYYQSRSEFCSAINPYVLYARDSSDTTSTDVLFVDSWASRQEDIYDHLINHYSIDTTEIVFSYSYRISSNFREYVVIITSSIPPNSSSFVTNDTISKYFGISLVFNTGDNPVLKRYVCYKPINGNDYNYDYYTNDNGVYSLNSYLYFYGVKPNKISIKPYLNADNSYSLGITAPIDPQNGWNNSYPNNPPPYSSNAYNIDDFTRLWGGFIFNNFQYWDPVTGTIINPGWIHVGEYLSYEFLCKNNIDSETISINGIDYPNYMYSFYSAISSLNDLSESLGSINDRLEMAFPDDQAELNDSIAETLMDDTNNTGLTAEKVSNAKSDFDDGISTYEIDTSGSAYSTPFAAIRGGDWSFWSQTTLDNMGSGYSYTYQQTRNTKASNDSDIYEENSRSLFDLLGW